MLREKTYDSIRLPNARYQSLANVVNGPVIRPSRGYDGVDVLEYAAGTSGMNGRLSRNTR